MTRFKRRIYKKNTPAISTASLPDIVFMLLFFFMVTTVMREKKMKVYLDLPKANEVVKLERRSLISYIYVGVPKKDFAGRYGNEPRIQLNDAIADINDIKEFIASERESREENLVPLLTTSLKIDKDVKMGIVTDIKQALREVNALRINYSSRKRD